MLLASKSGTVREILTPFLVLRKVAMLDPHCAAAVGSTSRFLSSAFLVSSACAFLMSKSMSVSMEKTPMDAWSSTLMVDSMFR